jgi:glycine dehydrogenase
MIQIRTEIQRIQEGEWPADDNPLVNAPHTAQMIAGDWPHPYSRHDACYPVESLTTAKYWPPVRRVNGPYGDRHLVTTCPSVAELTGV